MAGRSGRHGISRYETQVHDLLDRMEPDLRLLEGTVSVLRSLSEATDAVEPVAIEAVTHLAEPVNLRTAHLARAIDVPANWSHQAVAIYNL